MRKFVSFEGCEGAGKTTQVRLLKEYLDKQGIPAFFCREPGGTQISESIRDILLHTKNHMDSVCELLLYSAARAQIVSEVILPRLQQGQMVVCDRFFDSTLAYQGYARGLDVDMVQRINSIASHGLTPELTIFLDISPQQAFARKGGRDTNDRLEMQDMDFHMRVYEGYKSIKDDRFVCLDCSKSKFDTHQNVINLLKQRGFL